MTQKQIVGVVVGVAVMVLVSTLVYRFFVGPTIIVDDTASQTVATQKKMNTPEGKTVVPIPDTIDGIADSIVEESSVDFSALDEEEASSLNDVDEDSESVNNLGTSYDENNL